MRILITGVTGFAGRHLAAYARARADALYGLVRGGVVPEGVVPLGGDLADADAAASAVRESRADRVFHLAAQTPANSPRSTDRDWLVNNPLAALNLLEAVRRHRPQARVLIVSSSAVYGHVPESQLPIAETALLGPATMYGVSKAAVELLATRYAAEHGLHVVRARPFNLVGPGEPPAMLTTVLATQVAGMAAGRTDGPVRLRHRGTRRDYTDVRDAVAAYWAILERGAPGEVFNVCSGRAVSVGEVLDRLMAIVGVEASVEETTAGPEPGDILVQVGDPRKARERLGWEPLVGLDESLVDLVGSLSRAPLPT